MNYMGHTLKLPPFCIEYNTSCSCLTFNLINLSVIIRSIVEHECKYLCQIDEHALNVRLTVNDEPNFQYHSCKVYSRWRQPYFCLISLPRALGSQSTALLEAVELMLLRCACSESYQGVPSLLWNEQQLQGMCSCCSMSRHPERC